MLSILLPTLTSFFSPIPMFTEATNSTIGPLSHRRPSIIYRYTLMSAGYYNPIKYCFLTTRSDHMLNGMALARKPFDCVPVEHISCVSLCLLYSFLEDIMLVTTIKLANEEQMVCCFGMIPWLARTGFESMHVYRYIYVLCNTY